MSEFEFKRFIRDVPDFPKPGIVFKDITPLLKSPEAFSRVIENMTAPFRHAGITKVAAIESRGFIFGAPVAQALGAGFIPIRKPGKLPWTTFRNEYDLEYGTDALEIHRDALDSTDRVLLVDDVLATGGTAAAASLLIEMLGAHTAGYSMLIELSFLKGRERLQKIPFHATIAY
ncbi:MAG TPA: adenine phosphoribosyltransferase [Thermoanaerobaculia bacterium]|nr:adenine phosphoribosyltransferase [Thermoanaerobaculia bacterium]